MNDTFFFPAKLFTNNELDSVTDIFLDSEGIFPADQLRTYIENYSDNLESLAYSLVKYAFYKGTAIATQDEFFSYLSDRIGKELPEVAFWRAYDALIRGNLDTFEKLWSLYMSIELKNYKKDFIIEALVIPEDPIFLNVELIVHDHQQRLIHQFVLQDALSKSFSDTEYDVAFQKYIGKYSLLLSVFRLFQSSFDRDIIFNDLDNLLTLLPADVIDSLGPYWELRFLSIICYWKTSLGLVFDVVDNLTMLKNLNGYATNMLIESQIFHIEALLSYKNNQKLDSIELLQSAYYVAKEYGFFYQSIDVLFSKFTIDTDNLSETTELILLLTNDKTYPLIRAKLYALLGAYYIQEKNWSEAENKLLQASKLVQGSYDKKTYYQVIADFSYVLVITRQLQLALESSIVLLDDHVSLLYRIRGFYLYGLSLALLDQMKDAIEIIEEGIRIALSFKEHISLPWFYELLEFIYLSMNDKETALRYSNLTFKAYFDASKSDEGYRSKIRSSYILALNKDFGRSFTQVMSLFSEHLTPALQYESYSVLQLAFLVSQETSLSSKISEIWNNVNILDHSGPLMSLVKLKNNLLSLTESDVSFDGLNDSLEDNSFKGLLFQIEFLLLALIYADKPFTNEIDWNKGLSTFKNFFKDLNIKFSVFSNVKTFLDTKIVDQLQKNEKPMVPSSGDREVLFAAIFLAGTIRNLVDNLPFNFLSEKSKKQ